MKKFILNRHFGKVLFVGVMACAALYATIWGQTNPAPATPAQASGQIGPGSTGSISSQGVTPATADKPHQVLNSALTPQTRQTLWEAMNSVASPAENNASAATVVTIGPGEGAEMNGTTIDKIAFDSLPAPVKGALGGTTQNALSSGAGR